MRRRAPAALSLSIAIGLTALPLPSHAASAVLNGSFESPNISPNTIQAGGGASWTPSDANVFLVSNAANGPQTTFGTQFLGIAHPGSNDQQTVSGFVSGQSYVLDLFVSNIFNSQSPQLTVTISGAASASSMFNAAPTDGFSEASLPFTANFSGDITLSLIDSGLANIAVDNVTIEQVPEPSALFATCLVTGALAIRLLRRRRE